VEYNVCVVKLPRTTWWLGIVAGCFGAVGCSSSEEGDDGSSTGTGVGAVKPANILVDANRDGFVNDADDTVNKDVWDKTQGAAFLANLDDDNVDKVRDCDNEVVDGEADAFDLGRIILAPSPAAAGGTLAITATCGGMPCDALSYVNIFRSTDGKQWTREASGNITLNAADAQRGITFGIEGKTLVGLPEAGPWDGHVQLVYTVGTAVDKAKMRVSPWMMFGNGTPHIDTVFAAKVSPVFYNAIDKAVGEANADVKNVKFWRIDNWTDHWVEDYFQTGVISVPWDKGGVIGMRVSMPRPWGRSDADSALPVNWLKKSHLYADSGYMVVYKKAKTGSTFDSHGNHDLIPAYTNGAASYPYGRIIHGSNVLAETHAFYNAQQAQAPALEIDTDWLLVGHVDETLSYLPAATPRGWKLLVASPKMSLQMLKDAQMAGHGAVKMFIGKFWYTNNGTQAADISIDEVLADQDLMKASQEAQTRIDGQVKQLTMELGLAADEIVEMPTLFETYAEGGGEYNIAYQPGTVNLRAFNGYAIIPDPFGPVIDGKDIFKQDLIDRLSTAKHKLGKDGKGVKVYFADDWDWYHRLDGEVHCGSNSEGAPQPEWKWWEKVQ
jgi:protein-arginine deiminase